MPGTSPKQPALMNKLLHKLIEIFVRAVFHSTRRAPNVYERSQPVASFVDKPPFAVLPHSRTACLE